MKSLRAKKMKPAALAGVIALTLGAGIPAIGSATSSSAAICGYYEQTEDVGGNGMSISIGPLSFTLGGGKQLIAHYNHCGSNKTVKIKIQRYGKGDVDACVPPGDSRIGPASGNPWTIRYAYATGRC